MKKLQKLMTWFLILVMLVTMSPIPAQAASVNVTIALSKSTVNVGDTVTVTVSVKCSEAIGSYAMAVTYDSSVIEYNSGSGNGGGGTVNIAGYGDGESKTLKATLKFKALGSGSTKVTTTGGEAYTWGEESVNITHAGATVTVASDVQASTENKLESLSVSPGKLSPAFSPDTTSYNVSVGADVTELVVSAKAKDSKATVKLSGNKNLKPGKNTVKITVTAESGDKKVYTITCTKAQSENTSEENSTEEKSTESSETESETESSETEASSENTEAPTTIPTVLIEGVSYTFATEQDDIAPPVDFSQTTSSYNGSEIMAFAGPNEAIILVCMLDASGTQAWFMYDVATGGFMKYHELNTKVNRLFIMQAADDVEIPEGYRSVEVNMNGNIIPGFVNESNAEIMLVYAKTISGDTGLYLYDTSENSYIRYIEDALAVEEDTTAVEVVTTEEASTQNNGILQKVQNVVPYEIMLIIAGASILFLIIFAIMSASFATKLVAKEEEMDMLSAMAEHAQKQVAATKTATVEKDVKPEEPTNTEDSSPVSQDTVPVPIISLGEDDSQ